MQYIHRKWKLTLWAAAIAALGCFAPAPQSARAQSSVAGWPDREYDVRKAEAVSSTTRRIVAGALGSGQFEDDDAKPAFVDFYKKSLFPKVTDKANRQSTEDVVARLRKDLRSCEKAASKQVFNTLADLTVDYMTEIAKGNFHPAARVNAMLAIGEVNTAQGRKALLDTAFGRGQLFALRVAAMTGLVRMAGPSGKGVLSDPGIGPLVFTDMIALFRAKKKDDGMNWMRGQAADVLGDLGSTGPKGEIPPVLLGMLNDKDLPIPLRSKAARALGKLSYGDNLPVAGPYVTALAQFASDAFSSDQPLDRGRVRLVVRDVEDGLKPFAKSSNDPALSEGLQKTLQAIKKETESQMTADELKNSVGKAKTSLNSLLKDKR